MKLIAFYMITLANVAKYIVSQSYRPPHSGWQADTMGLLTTSVFTERHLYSSSLGGILSSIDLNNGEAAWRYYLPSNSTVKQIVLANDVLYSISQRNDDSTQTLLLCAQDAANGRVRWELEYIPVSIPGSGGNCLSDLAYHPSDMILTVLHCDSLYFVRTNGTTKWQWSPSSTKIDSDDDLRLSGLLPSPSIDSVSVDTITLGATSSIPQWVAVGCYVSRSSAKGRASLCGIVVLLSVLASEQRIEIHSREGLPVPVTALQVTLYRQPVATHDGTAVAFAAVDGLFKLLALNTGAQQTLLPPFRPANYTLAARTLYNPKMAWTGAGVVSCVASACRGYLVVGFEFSFRLMPALACEAPQGGFATVGPVLPLGSTYPETVRCASGIASSLTTDDKEAESKSKSDASRRSKHRSLSKSSGLTGSHTKLDLSLVTAKTPEEITKEEDFLKLQVTPVVLSRLQVLAAGHSFGTENITVFAGLTSSRPKETGAEVTTVCVLNNRVKWTRGLDVSAVMGAKVVQPSRSEL